MLKRTSYRIFSPRTYVVAIPLLLPWMSFFAAIALEPGLESHQEDALRAIAMGKAFTWHGLQPDQESAINRAAVSFENHFRKYHLPQGMVADILWSDYSRSEIVKYDGIGDSTTWTGVYLAVLAFQWHVTKNPVVLQEIDWVLSVFDTLTRVSGRIGYLVRYAGDGSDPAFRNYYQLYGGKASGQRPGFGVRAYPGSADFPGMVWLGHSSRDTYDGAGFGFAAAWHYVDDPATRQRVRVLVERIGDRLIKDNWKLIDGQGSHTWHTFRWRIAWTRLLLCVSPERFTGLESSYRRMALRFPLRGPKIPSKYTSGYYPANLNFMRMFVLLTLEDDECLRERYRRAMRNLYHRRASDHLNPHFAALYMAATGDTDNPNARATLEGMLLDYPDLPKWARKVVPSVLNGQPMKNEQFSRYALLTRERIPRDFLWQRSPCQAVGGTERPLEYPTLDFLLPYWMGRSMGFFSSS